MPRPQPTPVVAWQPRMSDLPKPSAWGRRVSPVRVPPSRRRRWRLWTCRRSRSPSFVLGHPGRCVVPLFHHAIRLSGHPQRPVRLRHVARPLYLAHQPCADRRRAPVCLSLCRATCGHRSLVPLMLGLIAGAATGNLVSLISSPEGVPDFIAVPVATATSSSLTSPTSPLSSASRFSSARPGRRARPVTGRTRYEEARERRRARGERRDKPQELRQAVGGSCLLSPFCVSPRSA